MKSIILSQVRKAVDRGHSFDAHASKTAQIVESLIHPPSEHHKHRRPLKRRIFHTVSRNMGVMVSRWWWGGDPDERNELSGMSMRDIYNVQQSWATINVNANANGFLIFFRLFKADPETKTFFKQLDHATTETEMAATVAFKAHIINIMATFNTSIENLDNPELVVVWMEKLGDSHRRFNIQKKHFWVLKDVLVNILQNDLKLTDDVVESWGRYVTFMYNHLLPRLSL